MTETMGAAAFAILVLLFAASANGLRRLWISAPLVFVAVGAALAVIGGAASSRELLWMRGTWVERTRPAAETSESVEPVTRSRTRLWPGRRG